MSNVCCKEFKGWCKSFTKTEIFLCALQAIFFIVLFAFLTFLILHLVVCLNNIQEHEIPHLVVTESVTKSTEAIVTTEFIGASKTDKVLETTKNYLFTENNLTEVFNESEDQPVVTERTDSLPTCTWLPSEKTKALTHYYENITLKINTQSNGEDKHTHKDSKLLETTPDALDISDERLNYLLALVKIRPPQDLTFDCTLTIISEYRTLTAASCIEAIDIDSLDSVVMMQDFGNQNQRKLSVTDIVIHPQYQRINKAYDLAALKSNDNLVKMGHFIVTLPTLIDYYLITIGERLSILGYGRFRNVDKDPLKRTIHEISVHSLPPSQCMNGTGTRSPRHLIRGTSAEPLTFGNALLCAGVLQLRTSPCNYCAGTPLLRKNLLLGIMSANQRCGVTCEPALFVNLAFVKDWLFSVLNS